MGAILGGVVLIGAPLTVLVFLAVPADAFAFLVGQSALLVLVVLVVVAGWHLVTSSDAFSGRAPFGSGDEHWTSREDVQRHEDGHAKLLRKYRVGVAWFGKVVYRQSDGYYAGYTMPASWTRFDRLPPEQQIAVYHAGHVAQHNTTARSGDDEVNIARIAGGDAGLERRGRALARRDLGGLW
jgi:hypothetical protein